MAVSLKTAAGGGGRRRRRSRNKAVMSEINVTPMVDVMLVLLIIFMVAAPLLTEGIPVDLPQVGGQTLPSSAAEKLVVSVTKDGRVYLGSEEQTPVSLDELITRLKAEAAKRKTSEAEQVVYVKGARDSSYEWVSRAISRIQKAGFRKATLVTLSEDAAK